MNTVSRFLKNHIVSLAGGTALLVAVAVSPASATTSTTSTEIDQVKTDITELTDTAKDVVLPTAGIVTAFTGGLMIIKRVIYA